MVQMRRRRSDAFRIAQVASVFQAHCLSRSGLPTTGSLQYMAASIPNPPYLMPSPQQQETYKGKGFTLVRSVVDQMFPPDLPNFLAEYKHRHYGTVLWARPAPFVMRNHAGFDTLDIGPIRTLYYQELALVLLHAEGDLDYPPLGRSFFDNSGVLQDKNDWLIHDRFLAEGLEEIGLTWTSVETAMFQAFWSALPQSFRALEPNKPSCMNIVSWKYALEDWGWYFARRKSISKKADELFPLVDGSPFSNELWWLKQVVSRFAWAEMPHLRIKNYMTQRNSSIVTAVLPTLADKLWHGMNYLMEPAPRLDFARTLSTKKAFNEFDESQGYAQAPVELWKFVADIIYHLSIIKGLPGTVPLTYKDQADDKHEILTYDAVRQRVAV